MKNLKRVLSLALATVMVIGMMVVGANAAFSDQSSIKYTNAVDTLVQLGVMNGMGDNTFAPNGTLTRAQAAKMVAYVKSGANATTISYYDGTTKFTDVTANHNWASGSINYCVANGIVTGMTATTFAPDASLTGAQLAKMMLVALGYPEKSENANQTLVGANWQLNAIRLATEAGLFAGLDSDFAATRAITREEAAQIMYNALFLNTWVISEYQNATPVYTKTGAALIVSAFKANTESATNTSDYKRPATQYTFTDGKKPITIAATPIVTYTTAVTENAVVTALGENADVTIATGKAYVNGVASVAQTKIEKADRTNTIGANGTVTELYKVNDGAGAYHYEMVQIVTYLAQVTKVTADNAKTPDVDERALELTVFDSTYPNGQKIANVTVDTKAEGFDSVYAAVKANDYVLVVPSSTTLGNTVTAMALSVPTSVNGTKTASTATYVKVNGTQYDLAAKAAHFEDNYKNTCKFFLDQYGYVIGSSVVVAAEEALNYAYVEQVQGVAATDALIGATTNALKVKVMYVDGSEAVVDYALTVATADIDGTSFKKGDAYYETIAANGTATKHKLTTDTKADGISLNTWYSFTKDANGAVVLKGLEATKAASATSFEITSANAGKVFAKDGYYATSSTVLTVVKDGKATTYTGYAKMPAMKEGSVKVLYTFNDDAKTITNIYVLGGSVVTAPTYAYYMGVGETTADGTYYKFFVNGKEESYILASAPADGTTVVTVTLTDGKATVTPVSPVTTGTVKAVDANYIVVGDSTVVYLTSTSAVYNVEDVAHGTVTADTLEKGDVISYAVNDNGELVVAYITTAN